MDTTNILSIVAVIGLFVFAGFVSLHFAKQQNLRVSASSNR